MKKSEIKEAIKAHIKSLMEAGKEVVITTNDGTSKTASSAEKLRAKQASDNDDVVTYQKRGATNEAGKNFSLKSGLEKVINQAWEEKDLIKAKQIVINFLEDSGIKEEDKKKMISTINAQPNKGKLDYYLANALLKFEGHSISKLEENKEFLRMQKRAGLITEGQYQKKLEEIEGDPDDYYGYNEPIDPNDYADDNSNEVDTFWESLGEGYYKEDDVYYTPHGFQFDYNPETKTFSSEIQYSDYGDDREEGEAKIDPMLNELEDTLEEQSEKKEFKWEIKTTSDAYSVFIKI